MIIMNYLGDYITKVFVPYDTYGEIDWFKILLSVVISLLIIFVVLVTTWANITADIKSKDKCFVPAATSEDIFVLAKDRYGNPMYKISYDFKTRNSNVTCECESGISQNTFTNIKVRDLKNVRDVNDIKKTCMCDKAFSTMDKLNHFYYGNQGVINYMKNNDISVFNSVYQV